jgi:hypothetical protein
MLSKGELNMDRKLLMKCVMTVCFITWLSLITPPACSQSKSNPTAIAFGHDIESFVTISVDVHSGDKEILIPYCGIKESEKLYLCNLAYRIEVKASEGWPLGKNFVFDTGGRPPDKWKIKHIPAGDWEPFYLQINLGMFNVYKGQTLRVIIDTWRDERSLRTGKNAIKLTTNEIQCE